MRIRFKKGMQKKFLEEVCKEMNMTLRKFSHVYKNDLDVSYSAMKRYRNETRLLSLGTAQFLTKKSGIYWKRFGIEKIISDNWGAVKGGKIGYKKMSRKYSKKLIEWKRLGGKNTYIKYGRVGKVTTKQIKLPKMSTRLAEFIGICLGDGTLTKYFLRISGDSRYDIKYLNHVSELCKGLFGVAGKISKDKKRNTAYLTISSIKICELLNSKYKLPYGDKILNNASVPRIVFSNKKYMIGCLRGLVDTDGSVSGHSSGLILCFSSRNKLLFNQAYDIGVKLNLFTYKNEGLCGTASWPMIKKYFKVVGSSNLRHIVRFHKKFSKGKILHINEVLKYYKDYNNINLPFKLRADGLVGYEALA